MFSLGSIFGGRSSSDTSSGFGNIVGNTLISNLANSAVRKVDQLLGIDTDTPNPQAVAIDNTSNKQDIVEFDNSSNQAYPDYYPDRLKANYEISDRQQAQMATFFPTITNVGRAVGTRVVPFIKKNLPAVTAIGGTSAMLNDIYTQNGLCSTSRTSKPYSVSQDGCISVTRKQQQKMKELVMSIGMDQASDVLGLDLRQIGLLLIKKFPRRAKGITGASMRTTKRTMRQLTRYAHDLDEFCKRPVQRRMTRRK